MTLKIEALPRDIAHLQLQLSEVRDTCSKPDSSLQRQTVIEET